MTVLVHLDAFYPYIRVCHSQGNGYFSIGPVVPTVDACRMYLSYRGKTVCNEPYDREFMAVLIVFL